MNFCYAPLGYRWQLGVVIEFHSITISWCCQCTSWLHIFNIFRVMLVFVIGMNTLTYIANVDEFDVSFFCFLWIRWYIYYHLYGFICIQIIDIRKWYNVSSMSYMPWMSWIRILKSVSYVAIYMGIHGYTCYHVNARIMKFIPNEIRIMFSRFLALLWFLI